MRHWLLVILAAALLGLGGAHLLQDDPGYVLIAWGQYHIEMSVWTGLFLLLAGFVAGSLLLQLVRSLLAARQRLVHWRKGRNIDLSQSRATRGMIAFSEGRWERARNLFAQAAERADHGLVYQLLAARASHALGETRECEHYLAKAAAMGGGAAMAAALTRAELALASGQPEQCLTCLVQAGDVSVHPSGLRMLSGVYQQLGDWQKLRELLPRLKKAAVLIGGELEVLEIRVYGELLRRASLSAEAAESAVAAVWRSVPRRLTALGDVQLSYAQALVVVGATRAAENYIRTSLRKNWNDKLVDLYGRLITDQPSRQFDFARNWLKGRENNAALLLALGRLSLANELWAGACEYFERSLALQPQPEVYAELGRLLVRLGKRDAGLLQFQQGLLASAPRLPELPLPK